MPECHSIRVTLLGISVVAVLGLAPSGLDKSNPVPAKAPTVLSTLPSLPQAKVNDRAALTSAAIMDLPSVPAIERPSWTISTLDLADLPAAPASTIALPPNAEDKLLIDELSSIEDRAIRKQAFVDLILPEIRQANAAILEDRHHVLRIRAALARGEDIEPAERSWLAALADAYKVSPDDLPELQNRVDIIPPSLALTQAALESGWGTSRLARKQLALFGQTDGGTGFASFASLAGGVSSYFRNLNTHKAYAEFRDARASARAGGINLDGYDLAAHLTDYSELGQGYVKKVRAIMTSNQFHLIRPATAFQNVAHR